MALVCYMTSALSFQYQPLTEVPVALVFVIDRVACPGSVNQSPVCWSARIISTYCMWLGPRAYWYIYAARASLLAELESNSEMYCNQVNVVGRSFITLEFTRGSGLLPHWDRI